MMKKKRRDYLSDIDSFLRTFDEKRSVLPLSRQKEREKHQRLFAKRDGVVEEETTSIWKGF